MKVDVHNNGVFVETVERKPIVKAISNFNPHWIRYKNKTHLVKGGVDFAYMHGDKPLGIEYYIDVNKELENEHRS